MVNNNRKEEKGNVYSHREVLTMRNTGRIKTFSNQKKGDTTVIKKTREKGWWEIAG